MSTLTDEVVGVAAVVPDRFRRRLAGLLTQAGTLGIAGAVSGFVAIGLGSRLAMRLVALTSGRIGTGVRPDSGAVPGQFTLEGTMFLLLAGTVGGAVIAAGVGVVLDRWLPGDRRSRAVTLAVLVAFLPGLVLLDPDNVDFALFGPTWFAVLLFTACALGYGALVAVLSPRWQHPSRRGGRTVRVAAGAGALGMAMVLGAGGLGWLVGAPVVLTVLALHLAPHDGRLRWWYGAAVDRAGRGVVLFLAVLAAAVTLVRIGQILT